MATLLVRTRESRTSPVFHAELPNGRVACGASNHEKPAGVFDPTAWAACHRCRKSPRVLRQLALADVVSSFPTAHQENLTTITSRWDGDAGTFRALAEATLLAPAGAS